jgi:hypothetical protein
LTPARKALQLSGATWRRGPWGFLHCRVTLAEIEGAMSIRGCGLLVEVSDPDRSRLPVPRPAGDGGRGLLLVGALSERWGHDVRPYSKCVWAYFLVPEESRCPS